MIGYRRLFFRIIYGSIYFLLYVVLIGLLLITPGDAIERSIVNKQTYNIWILTVIYVATVLTVCFGYILRLYVNKTALASIPKAWIPIEKSDVNENVYKMIGAGLNRSASIAFAARPRVKTPDEMDDEEEQRSDHQVRTNLASWMPESTAQELGVTSLPRHRAVWGEIEHYGWASPNSPDLPNLQYTTILFELPNLIEAKALTLAPLDPTSQTEPPMLDQDAVALLQRPLNMTLRAYLEHLASLGIITMHNSTIDFLTRYEFARFSTQAISNTHFRELMHLFAEILRGMSPLDLELVASIGEEQEEGEEEGVHGNWAPSESDIDNDAPARTNTCTPRSNLSRPGTASTEGSVRRHLQQRNSSVNAWSQYRTAPNTPGSRRTGDMISRQSSSNSFAQTRRPYPASQPSSSSLRSKMSEGSSSVIRLATHEDAGDLPYVLSLRDTTGSWF